MQDIHYKNAFQSLTFFFKFRYKCWIRKSITNIIKAVGDPWENFEILYNLWKLFLYVQYPHRCYSDTRSILFPPMKTLGRKITFLVCI